MRAIDLRAADGEVALPARNDFVAAYCSWRSVDEEHAGKLYDLLASEPAWRPAVADWAEVFMKEADSGAVHAQ